MIRLGYHIRVSTEADLDLSDSGVCRKLAAGLCEGLCEGLPLASRLRVWVLTAAVGGAEWSVYVASLSWSPNCLGAFLLVAVLGVLQSISVELLAWVGRSFDRLIRLTASVNGFGEYFGRREYFDGLHVLGYHV